MLLNSHNRPIAYVLIESFTAEILASGRVTADSEVKLKRSMIGLWRGGHRSMKQKPRSPKQRKHPKTRLRLPDLEFSKSAVLNSLRSVDGQRGYGHAIDEFVDWYCSEPRLALNRTVVLRYRSYLEARLLAPGTRQFAPGRRSASRL